MNERKIETHWKATSEFRFFIFDPEGDGFCYFKSKEDRDAAASGVIQGYLDDGWSEEVERVVAGEVTHTCQQTNVEHRPSEDQIDEEGCDGEGNYWGDYEYRCNYELVDLTKPA